MLAFTLALAAYGWAAWSRRWMSDDGYIYLRVVDELPAGNGPVFNRGERIEAATSPLWVGILSLNKEIFRPVSFPWLAILLGLVLSIAGLALRVIITESPDGLTSADPSTAVAVNGVTRQIAHGTTSGTQDYVKISWKKEGYHSP
jgi:hypothetical protein